MFPKESSNLTSQIPLPKSSSLLSLHPFMDSDGLIRVSGRLRHSRLSEAIKLKHPIILRSHPLLSLIIEHYLRTMYEGPQLTLALLRTEFWILRARATVRSVLYKCVPCSRETTKISNKLMGDLPNPRINRVFCAFIHTRVDYAGPIALRNALCRGHKSYKAYIVLFMLNHQSDPFRACQRLYFRYFCISLPSACRASRITASNVCRQWDDLSRCRSRDVRGIL